jgi:ketosteroid isomerase-like protein
LLRNKYGKEIRMKKFFVSITLAVALAAMLSTIAVCKEPKGDDAAAVAAITKLENDAVQADLANDSAFYEKLLADDWTGGTSRGTWDTKSSLLADMKDTKNNKTNSESISEVQVRVHGDMALATYKTTYDSIVHGQHLARTIISTDIFRREGNIWKEVANHSSLVKDNTMEAKE